MAEELIAEISPGCVRIIVDIAGRTGAGDFMVDVLPQWMESLEASSEEAMVRGTDEGTALACEIAFDAVRLEEWDLACIAALWIILYAPGQSGISMNDLKNMAGIGVFRIRANADGSLWHSEASLGDVPADVANGRALLINDYAASPVQARAPSLVGVAEGAA